MKYRTAVWRALNLRCPVCGKGKVARGFFATEPECSECQTDFVVERGYFLGAIYINYGVTASLALAVFLPLSVGGVVSTRVLMVSSLLFCVLFPLWFFRYARSLWLSFDYFYDVRNRRPTDDQGLRTEEPNADSSTLSTDAESLVDYVCPLCHDRFGFDPQCLRTWSNCPACRGAIFLLPVAATRSEKRFESSDPEDHVP